MMRRCCYVLLYLGCSNKDLPILWSAQVVHDAHKLTGLSLGLLTLRHMQIHLVAVKVSIIGAADTLIEPKRPAALQVLLTTVLPRSGTHWHDVQLA